MRNSVGRTLIYEVIVKLSDLLPKGTRYKPGELAMVVLIQHLLSDHGLTAEQIKDLFGKAMSMDDEVIQKFIRAK